MIVSSMKSAPKKEHESSTSSLRAEINGSLAAYETGVA